MPTNRGETIVLPPLALVACSVPPPLPLGKSDADGGWEGDADGALGCVFSCATDFVRSFHSALSPEPTSPCCCAPLLLRLATPLGTPGDAVACACDCVSASCVPVAPGTGIGCPRPIGPRCVLGVVGAAVAPFARAAVGENAANKLVPALLAAGDAAAAVGVLAAAAAEGDIRLLIADRHLLDVPLVPPEDAGAAGVGDEAKTGVDT